MRLHTIAFKNLARRKGKATLVVVGLAVGIATMVSIVTLMLAFEKSIDTQLDAYGFNIVVYPASSSLSLNYGGMNISGVDTFEVETLTEADLGKARRIRSADHIMAISPKVLQAIEVKNKKALLVGVDFDEEFQVKKWWKVTGHKPSSKDQVILGSDAAKSLRLKVGDSVKIGSQTFKVAGILHETGSQDDGLVFSDIELAQSLFGRGQELSLIEISARRSDQIDTVVAELEKALPGAEVSSIKQAVKYREEAMGSLVRRTGSLSSLRVTPSRRLKRRVLSVMCAATCCSSSLLKSRPVSALVTVSRSSHKMRSRKKRQKIKLSNSVRRSS
jgi:putative ABC transport system permease protein